MSIKLIALDLDGTLLDDDHATIPARNVEALRRAAGEKGVKLAIASGRSWSLVRDIARALGPVRYGITANGGYTVDAATGETMTQMPMGRAQCAAVIAVMRKYRMPYELYLGGENYVQYSDRAGSEKYVLSVGFQEVFLRNTTWVEDMLEAVETGEPIKFDIFHLPEEHREAILAELAATGPLGYTKALRNNLELTAPGVSKGVALRELSGKLGLGPEEVMAFGDADNDLSMLSWAGWSFAMANAVPAAKAAARYTTGTNHDAGVAMAVEKYVLGQ